jgi:hypothetical protein
VTNFKSQTAKRRIILLFVLLSHPAFSPTTVKNGAPIVVQWHNLTYYSVDITRWKQVKSAAKCKPCCFLFCCHPLPAVRLPCTCHGKGTRLDWIHTQTSATQNIHHTNNRHTKHSPHKQPPTHFPRSESCPTVEGRAISQTLSSFAKNSDNLTGTLNAFEWHTVYS